MKNIVLAFAIGSLVVSNSFAENITWKESLKKEIVVDGNMSVLYICIESPLLEDHMGLPCHRLDHRILVRYMEKSEESLDVVDSWESYSVDVPKERSVSFILSIAVKEFNVRSEHYRRSYVIIDAIRNGEYIFLLRANFDQESLLSVLGRDEKTRKWKLLGSIVITKRILFGDYSAVLSREGTKLSIKSHELSMNRPWKVDYDINELITELHTLRGMEVE